MSQRSEHCWIMPSLHLRMLAICAFVIALVWRESPKLVSSPMPVNRTRVEAVWSSSGLTWDSLTGDCVFEKVQNYLDGSQQNQVVLLARENQNPRTFLLDSFDYSIMTSQQQAARLEVQGENFKTSRPVVLTNSNTTKPSEGIVEAHDISGTNTRWKHMWKVGVYDAKRQQFALKVASASPQNLDKIINGETPSTYSAPFGSRKKNITITKLDSETLGQYNSRFPGENYNSGWLVHGFSWRAHANNRSECTLRRITNGIDNYDDSSKLYLQSTTGYLPDFQYCLTGTNLATGDSKGRWGPWVDVNPEQPIQPASNMPCPFYCPASTTGEPDDYNQTLFFKQAWANKSCLVALGYPANKVDCYGPVGGNQFGYGQQYPKPYLEWQGLNAGEVQATNCADVCQGIGRSFNQQTLADDQTQANKCYDSSKRQFSNCICGPMVNDALNLEVAISPTFRIGLAKSSANILINTANNTKPLVVCHGKKTKRVVMEDGSEACKVPARDKGFIVKCAANHRQVTHPWHRGYRLIACTTPGAGPSNYALLDDWPVAGEAGAPTLNDPEGLLEFSMSDVVGTETRISADVTRFEEGLGSFSESTSGSVGEFAEPLAQAVAEGGADAAADAEVAAIMQAASSSSALASDTGFVALSQPLIESGIASEASSAAVATFCGTWGATIAVGGIVLVLAAAATVGILVLTGVIPVPSGCHPSHATVNCSSSPSGEDASIKRIDQVRLGDYCQTHPPSRTRPGQFSRVFFSSHNDTRAVVDHVKLTTSCGHSVSATGDHYVEANGTATTFDRVAAGDTIVTSNGECTVSQVQTEPNVGLHHPMTENGALMVDHVQVRTMSGWVLERMGFNPSAWVADLYHYALLPVMLAHHVNPEKVARFLEHNPSIANATLSEFVYKMIMA